MKQLLPFLLILLFANVWAQDTFPLKGVSDERPSLYAFVNANIQVDYQTIIENATLVIHKDKVLNVGSEAAIPGGTKIIDLKGKYIYPAFIDPYADYGISSPQAPVGGQLQYESERDQAYGWNDNIRADYDAIGEFVIRKSEAELWKKIGFGAVNTYKPDGLIRGTSAFVTLAEESPNKVVLKDKAALHYSFIKSASTRQQYPKSIMGKVALIRQTYLDANWYVQSDELPYNLTLDAFNKNQELPQVFEAAGDKLRVLLADKVGDEFGKQYIIKGNGDEYQRAEAIKTTNAPLILPLNFPNPYNVDDPLKSRDVSLAQMKHWELAPYNAKILNDQGVEFAFTTHGMSNKTEFWATLRKLRETGLSEAEVLKALTYTPAKYFDVENQVGSLKNGMLANFFILSDDLFSKETKIHETWVQGERYTYLELDAPNYAGKYKLVVDTSHHQFELVRTPSGHSGVIHKPDSTIQTVNFSRTENTVLISYSIGGQDVRLSGWVGNQTFGGIGVDQKGQEFKWSATKTTDDTLKSDSPTPLDSIPEVEIGEVIYPFVAHGFTEAPKQETILFQNATVWTLEGEGKLKNADVLVEDGKIKRVGTNLSVDGVKIIDATGKHLTPGIIDEHSHIALSAVNEGSLAITSEARMYDAVNSEDINIYRNLAGGVTTAQLLHGSANPVGGQSAIVKMRWGATPAEMKVSDAPPFIKFALGENVKQSNWGDQYKERFPQTRMGVEQLYIDGFARAKAYEEEWKKYNSLSKKEKAKTDSPRKDLRLEALLEIINQERFITCHSYVQSEINMLMHVADQFDFNVNTFTHILEGYKVADKMAEHGAGGSTFSDWWAYKYEVMQAIPYNANLMSEAGVTVAINSDDPEMARRLNQEAAKSMKYGDMSEIEALKMVTLNPAKLLHLDHRMGSIKAGKDADLVLWNDHPLSIYAKAELTLVDGKVLYSLDKDAELRKYIQAERTRLINKMRQAKAGGSPTQEPDKEEDELFHCDTETTGLDK